MITTLRSRVEARAAPPVSHLDTINLQEEPPNEAPPPPSSPGTPSQPQQLSPSQDSPLTVLTEEIQKFNRDGGTGDALLSETSSSGPADRSETNNSVFVGHTDGTDSKSLATPASQLAAEATADPKQAVSSLKSPSLHRKYRSLVSKRQIPGASGKSKRQTRTSH